MSAIDDRELVRSFNCGDEAAFREIVARHRDRMMGLAWSILRNSDDAEEIVQDTFVRAYRGLSTFRCECALSTWLYRIASRLAFNRYHSMQRRARREMHPASESPDGQEHTWLENASDPTLGSVAELELKELAGSIRRCTRQLPSPYRRILNLRNRRRRSYSTIGRELGVLPGTVKSRLCRARETLRLRVAEVYPGF